MIPLSPAESDADGAPEHPEAPKAILDAAAVPTDATAVLPEAPTEVLASGELPSEVSPPLARRALPFATVSLGLAVALLLAQFLAVNLASTGNPVAATVIAQTLIWLTAVPFMLGAVALVRGPHRGWAITAMIVSVIANPFILRNVLSFFGSL